MVSPPGTKDTNDVTPVSFVSFVQVEEVFAVVCFGVGYLFWSVLIFSFRTLSLPPSHPYLWIAGVAR